MKKSGTKWNKAWAAFRAFFPGLFDNEALIAMGHGIAEAFRALRRGIEYLQAHKWSARWGFLVVTGLLMWAVYCIPTIHIHELAARHPSEIVTVRSTVTKYGRNSANLNGAWEERTVYLAPGDANYDQVLACAQQLEFRRYIGEPLARLVPDKDGVSAEGLKAGDRVMRLEFLNADEHAYFTLLCYPDACYYAKDGWGSTDKFLPVVMRGGSDSAKTLENMLFNPSR